MATDCVCLTLGIDPCSNRNNRTGSLLVAESFRQPRRGSLERDANAAVSDHSLLGTVRTDRRRRLVLSGFHEASPGERVRSFRRRAADGFWLTFSAMLGGAFRRSRSSHLVGWFNWLVAKRVRGDRAASERVDLIVPFIALHARFWPRHQTHF